MSGDSIDVKLAYVHLVGDLAAGALLSLIACWFLPPRTGDAGVRVERDGKLWLAKRREDWSNRCGITPKQLDRCIAELEKRGFIWTAVYKFNGLPVKHVSLNWSGLIQQFSEIKSEIDPGGKAQFTFREKPNSPLGERAIHLWASSSNAGRTAQVTAETTTEFLALTSPGEIPATAPAIFITLLLNDKSKFAVTEEMIEQWVPLYPGVDVRQSLRTMCGWLLNNERRRKTRSGIKAFIGNWLGRDQNNSNFNGGQRDDRNRAEHRDDATRGAAYNKAEQRDRQIKRDLARIVEDTEDLVGEEVGDNAATVSRGEPERGRHEAISK